MHDRFSRRDFLKLSAVAALTPFINPDQKENENTTNLINTNIFKKVVFEYLLPERIGKSTLWLFSNDGDEPISIKEFLNFTPDGMLDITLNQAITSVFWETSSAMENSKPAVKIGDVKTDLKDTRLPRTKAVRDEIFNLFGRRKETVVFRTERKDTIVVTKDSDGKVYWQEIGFAGFNGLTDCEVVGNGVLKFYYTATNTEKPFNILVGLTGNSYQIIPGSIEVVNVAYDPIFNKGSIQEIDFTNTGYSHVFSTEDGQVLRYTLKDGKQVGIEIWQDGSFSTLAMLDNPLTDKNGNPLVLVFGSSYAYLSKLNVSREIGVDHSDRNPYLVLNVDDSGNPGIQRYPMRLNKHFADLVNSGGLLFNPRTNLIYLKYLTDSVEDDFALFRKLMLNPNSEEIQGYFLLYSFMKDSEIPLIVIRNHTDSLGETKLAVTISDNLGDTETPVRKNNLIG